MKYTVNTTDESIEIEVSSPVELRDLIADLETIEERYKGYTVTITPPPVFTNGGFWGGQPNIQPLNEPYNPNNPFPGQPNIVYCSTTNTKES